MLATEIASVKEYMQVRDHNLHNFPPKFQEYGMAAQIGESNFYIYDVDVEQESCKETKYPMKHGCVIGTQVLPLTSASKYWMDKVNIIWLFLFGV